MAQLTTINQRDRGKQSRMVFGAFCYLRRWIITMTMWIFTITIIDEKKKISVCLFQLSTFT